MKSRIIAALVSVVFFISGCGSSKEVSYDAISDSTADYYDGVKIGVEIGSQKWCSELARSDEKKTLGLSRRGGLESRQAMLFFFNTPLVLSFWMKDMMFDIDIVWINTDRVVDISRSVKRPDGVVDDASMPRYTPKAPANLVLETPASEAAKLHLNDKVEFTSSCEKTLF